MSPTREGTGVARGGDGLTGSVVRFVAGQPRAACFVAEVRAALVGSNADPQALEEALGHLVATGELFLQHNFCPDPHFVDEDLRVVALIGRDGPGVEEAAVESAQRLWQQWLADVLAAHRCT